jgi:uncharacterized repeat protein (TIGR01451 family)
VARPLHRFHKTSALLVVAFLVSLAAVSPTAAATGDLYAVTGAGGGTCTQPGSELYTLDPATAEATLVGPILDGSTPVVHVTGIAIHPTTGQMYAVAGAPGPSCFGGVSTLYAVDKATGAATVVGSFESLVDAQIPDITFDPFGNLYGWNEFDDDLIRIDITNGTYTTVGECDCGTAQTGLAVNSAGAMYMKSGSELNRMSHAAGTIVDSLSLSANPHNILAFSPTDVLFTGTRGDPGPSAFTLSTIDLATGTLTTIGTNAIERISAIEFDRGVVTPPPVADLSLTKAVDDATPEVGQAVTFTIIVSNAGPVQATGVHVSDALPAGYTYVDDTASQGTYDSATGDWDVGTLADAASATLTIEATAVSTSFEYTNVAEVSAVSQFDLDSFPGDADPDQDDIGTQVTTPFDPDLDGSVSVDVKGQSRASAKNKSFTVTIANVGASTFTVTNTDLQVTVASPVDTDGVECRSFSAAIEPGGSIRARCSAALNQLGAAPGDPITYQATLTFVLDVNEANNTDSLTVTAR